MHQLAFLNVCKYNLFKWKTIYNFITLCIHPKAVSLKKNYSD